ncbi:MAG: hypothetical protein M1825_003870 [Sarcosagium campestre]|nr:MAG: hypothetical protein M1825_003870 [Sarcosagium campestre]
MLEEDPQFSSIASKPQITCSSAQDISVNPATFDLDVEKTTIALDHVVLDIQGLTCTGCETKLYKSLDSIPAVRNLRTSLVLSQAEFDLDKRTAKVGEIVSLVERSTGFTCKETSSTGQDLEVVVRGKAAEFVSLPKPAGVHDITELQGQTVCINYNARIVGARDMIETHFQDLIQLAPLRPDSALVAGSAHVRKTAFMTALSIVLTIPVLVLAWAPIPEHEIPYGSVSLALATIVQFVVAGPFYPSALKALIFAHTIEMDLLIVLSTTAAYVFSVVAFGYLVRGQPLETEGFFETSTLLVTLIMVGRLVSAMARQKAVESISIRSLQATTALLVGADGSNEREIDARLLQHGDYFKVPPDSHITTDGIIQTGESEIDESMLTGESKPLEKRPGSAVIAGSVNGSGSLVVRLTHLPGDNTISEIARMVDAARFSKPKIQEMADRIAGYFVPVVLLLTVITFVIWLGINKGIRKQSASTAAVRAITYGISVLIVSCPCAIGLAVPMVVVIAGGVAAKRGVVFKSAETIENAWKVAHVVFDKTGTITSGQLSISAEEYLPSSSKATAGLVLGLTSSIRHPVSIAISNHLKASGVQPVAVESVKSVIGRGIEGHANGIRVRAGNSRWLEAEDLPLVKSLLSRDLSVFCVSVGDELVAVFGLEDSVRPDAGIVVSELKRRGIAVSMVSGDDSGAVKSIADQLGLSPSDVRSRFSPGDKQKYIQDLMDRGRKVVLFCGDGTNDAVALAQATIGLHITGGTDIAQNAADAVLVRPLLRGVLLLIDVSRASYHRIVFNFAWAFLYNLFAILLAGGAFVYARIPPQYAGLGELVSVVPVIFIALQLKWARFASAVDE